VPSVGHVKSYTQIEEKKESDNEMKAKMTVVASALIIGLMLIGASYALWYKYLVINGTVKTGRLDAEFTQGYWDSSMDQEGLIPVPPEKQIYTVEMYYDVFDNVINYEYIHIDIDHLYPCIWIHAYFQITNTGTIPLKFQYYFVQAGSSIGDGKFPGDVILSGDLYGLQLEPGEYAWGDVHIHLNNSALENQPLGTYYFWIYLMPVQWNEFNPLAGPQYP